MSFMMEEASDSARAASSRSTRSKPAENTREQMSTEQIHRVFSKLGKGDMFELPASNELHGARLQVSEVTPVLVSGGSSDVLIKFKVQSRGFVPSETHIYESEAKAIRLIMPASQAMILVCSKTAPAPGYGPLLMF